MSSDSHASAAKGGRNEVKDILITKLPNPVSQYHKLCKIVIFTRLWKERKNANSPIHKHSLKEHLSNGYTQDHTVCGRTTLKIAFTQVWTPKLFFLPCVQHQETLVATTF